ncbi:MAG: DEAD/DEAH box helicase [Elusimicrobium sp.]|jgi:superfamily II DNA/RNA helicase|nr:DEAD/DEAH box helicase [Elusimicrobium sp.]
MNNFEQFGFSGVLLNTIKNMGFVTPTPVQAAVIPQALEGRDILASAQTGSGKTCAFALPVIEVLSKESAARALVVAPTRELAQQVYKVFAQCAAGFPDITCVFLVGGLSVSEQAKKLACAPRVVIGTPGRINDHINRGNLELSGVKIAVWDEADRMLEIGFMHQIEKIISHLPSKKQTLMFSATLPKRILQLAGKYMVNPVRIAVDPENAVAQGIKEEFFRVPREQKFEKLKNILKTKGGSTLVFARTHGNVDWMTKALQKEGFNARAIHGGFTQAKRSRAIREFREEKFDVLVATDIAARGLDITHIAIVINYDLPLHPEDYVHRIGRTARAARAGLAISFISDGEKELWEDIEQFLKGKDVPQRPAGAAHHAHKEPRPAPRAEKTFAEKRRGHRQEEHKRGGKKFKRAKNFKLKGRESVKNKSKKFNSKFFRR